MSTQVCCQSLISPVLNGSCIFFPSFYLVPRENSNPRMSQLGKTQTCSTDTHGLESQPMWNSMHLRNRESSLLSDGLK